MEYDDNPFESMQGRRGSWVNRFYMVSSGALVNNQWGQLRAKHQWGIKRFWNEEGNVSDRRQVIANQLDVEGATYISDRLRLMVGGEVKIKDVSKVPSEQGYLHTAMRSALHGALGPATGGIRWRYSGDTARKQGLADLAVQELGLDFGYQRGRSLEGRMGLTWRWLNYDRTRLVLGPAEFGSGDQRDVRLEWTVGLQFYRAMLTDVSYTWLDNRSNSLGYDFRAYRLQLLMSRHFRWGIDGQAYLTTQRRNYHEKVRDPLPFGVTEEEEYAQTLVSFKLSRQLTRHYGLSGQYRYARNGNRSSVGFYRKNSYGLSLDFSF
jgi:hypothetical protein